MKAQALLGWLAAVAFTSITLQADPLPGTFAGTFSGDDFVEYFGIQVGPNSSLTAFTTSYAGSGGFDPTLTLWDAQGNLVQIAMDGNCGTVNADPATGYCLDAFLSQINLTTAGIYTLALTEAPNQGQNSLGQPDTLIYPLGSGNFTCAMFGGSNPDLPFCDAFGDLRNGSWALTISGSALISVVDQSVPGGVTPEPATLSLFAVGLALAIRQAKKQR